MLKNEKGFTLIELVIVLCIIGILVSVVVEGLSGGEDNAVTTVNTVVVTDNNENQLTK